MQLVELRADLAPDARLLRRVLDRAAGRGAPAGACGTGRTAPCAGAMYPSSPRPGWPGSSSSSVTSGGVDHRLGVDGRRRIRSTVSLSPSWIDPPRGLGERRASSTRSGPRYANRAADAWGNRTITAATLIVARAAPCPRHAGTVLAIGPSVKRFRVGDRVWGSNKGCSGDRSPVRNWLASARSRRARRRADHAGATRARVRREPRRRFGSRASTRCGSRR